MFGRRFGESLPPSAAFHVEGGGAAIGFHLHCVRPNSLPLSPVGTRVSVMRDVRQAHVRVTRGLMPEDRRGSIRYGYCGKVARLIAAARLRQSHRHYPGASQ